MSDRSGRRHHRDGEGGGRGSPSPVRGWRAVAGDAWFDEGLPRGEGHGSRAPPVPAVLHPGAQCSGAGRPERRVDHWDDKPPGSGFSEADYARVRTLSSYLEHPGAWRGEQLRNPAALRRPPKERRRRGVAGPRLRENEIVVGPHWGRECTGNDRK